MKISLPQKQNILKIPDEFASLQSTLLGGTLSYEFEYKINPFLASHNKCNLVKISIYKELPNQKPPEVFTSNFLMDNVGIAINNILQRNIQSKSTIKSNKNTALLSVTSDFTARIPNDKISVIANSNGMSFPIFTERVFGNISTEQNSSLPIFERSIKPINTEARRLGSEQSQAIAMDLIYNQSIDPAEIFMKEDSIVSAKSAFSGVSRKFNQSIFSRDNQTRNFIDSMTSDSEQTSDQQTSDGLLLQQPFNKTSEFLTITETIDISTELIGTDDFYVGFELIDNSNLVKQIIYRNVENNKNTSNLLTPLLPPLINSLTIPNKGVNYLELKQDDKNGTRVFLYRKKMPISEMKLDAEYQFVGNYKLSINDSTIKIADFYPSMCPIIYRAISVGVNETKSSEFSSTIIKGKIAGAQNKIQKLKNLLSFTYELQEKGIELIIRGIPSNVFVCKIYKTQIGTIKNTKILDKPILTEGKDVFTLTDSAVTSGKIYIYNIVLVYKDGKEEKSPASITVEYNPVSKNTISTRISSPQVKQNGNQLDVEFSVASSFVESSEEQIRSRLLAGGILELFSNNLALSRLQELIAYFVTRINVTTGDIENLGLLNGTQFSDVSLSSTNNASSVKDGNEYKYVVTTFLRDPRTLLRNYVETITNPINSLRTYSFKPYKWLHPETITNGTIVTDESLQRNHCKSQFSFGIVANISSVTVSLANVFPTVHNAKASKVNSFLNKISWKVQGNINKIDHFIIKINILGMSSVQGKCHNISDTGQFQFLDKLSNGESGMMYYEIIPIFYDYSRGLGIKTNQVIV